MRGEEGSPGWGTVGGTLVGVLDGGQCIRSMQVLQEKLRDGNLDPEELAMAAAAQVGPVSAHLASLMATGPAAS